MGGETGGGGVLPAQLVVLVSVVSALDRETTLMTFDGSRLSNCETPAAASTAACLQLLPSDCLYFGCDDADVIVRMYCSPACEMRISYNPSYLLFLFL